MPALAPVTTAWIPLSQPDIELLDGQRKKKNRDAKAAVTEARADLGQPVGLVAQRAVANYLDSGALRLHTQRMRNRYRRRRAQVVAALSGVPGLRVSPMDGGLHAVVETERPEAEVVAGLAASGVRVSPLSEYWSGAGSSGIVFGFGAVSEADLDRGLDLIATICAGRRIYSI